MTADVGLWRTKRGLSGRDRQMAALVAAGRTYAEVGTAVGCSARTVERAMSRPDVRELVSVIRAEVVERSVGRLADAMTDAATVLRAMATGAKQEQVRVSAARAVLEFALRGWETAVLAAKVRELESVVKGITDAADARTGRKAARYGPPDGPPAGRVLPAG